MRLSNPMEGIRVGARKKLLLFSSSLFCFFAFPRGDEKKSFYNDKRSDSDAKNEKAGKDRTETETSEKEASKKMSDVRKYKPGPLSARKKTYIGLEMSGKSSDLCPSASQPRDATKRQLDVDQTEKTSPKRTKQHQESDTEDDDDEVSSSDSESYDSEENFCEYCKKGCPSRDALENHLYEFHKDL